MFVAFSNFTGAVWTRGKQLIRFQSEGAVFIFLRRWLDGSSKKTLISAKSLNVYFDFAVFILAVGLEFQFTLETDKYLSNIV